MTGLRLTLKQMQGIAKEAGSYMLGASAGDLATEEKTNSKDFVSVADIKSQNIIKARLLDVFPNLPAVSEEDREDLRMTLLNPGFTGFVIDPIDGTYNFKRGMRESAISIGYIEVGEPKVGVIYDPYKDELFSAIKDQGAHCNGVQITVSSHEVLSGASVATSNSYDDTAMARNLRRHLAIYEHSGVMPWTNCPGSGVLIMANIACGRFDAYHHNGLKPWDNAAAFLLVREAGGIVERLSGGSAHFTDSAILMGNREIIRTIRETFELLPSELLT